MVKALIRLCGCVSLSGPLKMCLVIPTDQNCKLHCSDVQGEILSQLHSTLTLAVVKTEFCKDGSFGSKEHAIEIKIPNSISFDGDVPQPASYGVYISQLSRFAGL